MVLICYDYRFPELYREYKRSGVEIMFHSFHAANASAARPAAWRDRAMAGVLHGGTPVLQSGFVM